MSEDPPAEIPPERRLFAERMLAARQRAGLTQVQLAAAAGLTQPHISQLESGALEPKLSTIVAIAKALDIPVAALTDP